MQNIKKIAASIACASLLLVTSLSFSGDTTNTVDKHPSVGTGFNTNPTYLVISPRKTQSEEQQYYDQLECFNKATEDVGWDPYLAYDELVTQGYARALSRQNMEDNLVDAALDAAAIGKISEGIVGGTTEHPEQLDPNNIEPPGEATGSDDVLSAAAAGAALGASLANMDFSFLYEPDDPKAQREVSRFERNLNKWEQKYSSCLRRKSYKVQADDY